jgi:hypothetical protein
MAVLKPEKTGEILRPMVIGASVALLLVLPWAAHRLGSWLRRLHILEPRVNRRRASRVMLSIPVFVYGWRKNEPFTENTETVNVSAIGALMPISFDLARPEALILTNLKTNEDSLCRVARALHAADGAVLIGVEFLQASANFWRVKS